MLFIDSVQLRLSFHTKLGCSRFFYPCTIRDEVLGTFAHQVHLPKPQFQNSPEILKCNLIKLLSVLGWSTSIQWCLKFSRITGDGQKFGNSRFQAYLGDTKQHYFIENLGFHGNVPQEGNNTDERCCQRTFSTPMCNIHSVKNETKRAYEGLFMSLVGQ